MQNERILRISEVIETTGLCRASIYDAIKAGIFPRQVKLTRRCVGWRMSEIHKWIESRTPANGGPA